MAPRTTSLACLGVAVLLLCSVAAARPEIVNNNPVIGVLAVPADNCGTRRRLSSHDARGEAASATTTGSCFSTVYSKVRLKCGVSRRLLGRVLGMRRSVWCHVALVRDAPPAVCARAAAGRRVRLPRATRAILTLLMV